MLCVNHKRELQELLSLTLRCKRTSHQVCFLFLFFAVTDCSFSTENCLVHLMPLNFSGAILFSYLIANVLLPQIDKATQQPIQLKLFSNKGSCHIGMGGKKPKSNIATILLPFKFQALRSLKVT